ncbi:MAG: hypothetical protein V1686_02165 [Patescibacteria group bacterium]
MEIVKNKKLERINQELEGLEKIKMEEKDDIVRLEEDIEIEKATLKIAENDSEIQNHELKNEAISQIKANILAWEGLIIMAQDKIKEYDSERLILLYRKKAVENL